MLLYYSTSVGLPFVQIGSRGESLRIWISGFLSLQVSQVSDICKRTIECLCVYTGSTLGCFAKVLLNVSLNWNEGVLWKMKLNINCKYWWKPNKPTSDSVLATGNKHFCLGWCSAFHRHFRKWKSTAGSRDRRAAQAWLTHCLTLVTGRVQSHDLSWSNQSLPWDLCWLNWGRDLSCYNSCCEGRIKSWGCCSFSSTAVSQESHQPGGKQDWVTGGNRSVLPETTPLSPGSSHTWGHTHLKLSFTDLFHFYFI